MYSPDEVMERKISTLIMCVAVLRLLISLPTNNLFKFIIIIIKHHSHSSPAGVESDSNPTTAAPSQTEVTNLNCSDHSTTSKEMVSWRALVCIYLTPTQDQTPRYNNNNNNNNSIVVFGPTGGSSLYSRNAQHVLQLPPSSPTQTHG